VCFENRHYWLVIPDIISFESGSRERVGRERGGVREV